MWAVYRLSSEIFVLPFFFFLIISYLTQEEAGCTINKRSSRIELVVWGESSKFRRRAGGGGAPPMP